MACDRLEDLGKLQITTSSLPDNSALLTVGSHRNVEEWQERHGRLYLPRSALATGDAAEASLVQFCQTLWLCQGSWRFMLSAIIHACVCADSLQYMITDSALPHQTDLVMHCWRSSEAPASQAADCPVFLVATSYKRAIQVTSGSAALTSHHTFIQKRGSIDMQTS